MRTLLFTLAGAVIVVTSFVATTFILNWLSVAGDGSASSRDQPALGKEITIIGDAGASTPILQADTSFNFRGDGLARIEDTSGLRCLTNKCSFSVAVEFPGSKPDKSDHYEVIIGQTYAGEAGWHLLWTTGGLYIQPDGGGSIKQMTIPFFPTPGEKYVIEVMSGESQVSMVVNGKIVDTNSQSPFTDIARPLTVGGREGPEPTYLFAGKISNLRITSLPTHQHP
jgi:hypothetical protein